MIHTTEHDNGIVVVRPGVERLTAVHANSFKTETCALVEKGASQIIIDFEEVSFLDSSGLGALVGVMKRIGHRGDIAVCGLDDELKLMFRISRMDKVFNAYPDAKSAVLAVTERL